MVESGLGWINSHYCQRLEFSGLGWVDGCRQDVQQVWPWQHGLCMGARTILKSAAGPSVPMAKHVTNLEVLNYFEAKIREFIVDRLSATDNWWKACIPPDVRESVSEKSRRARKLNDVLNKPDYEATDYLNFDHYGKIISKRDNWRNHFGEVFVMEQIFEYKMNVILSLRNDIMHGRALDGVNSLRLRLHCYDILSQIREAQDSDWNDRNALLGTLGIACADGVAVMEFG